MIMFDTQLVVVEQVIPKSRHFSGWISEQRIHTTGAALIAYPAIHIMVMPTESQERPLDAVPLSNCIRQ